VPQPLQYQHAKARFGQVSGRYQAVVAPADDDDINVGRVLAQLR
jgi:hypothetical protein